MTTVRASSQSLGVDQTTWLWDIAPPEPERWDEGTRQDIDDWGVPAADTSPCAGSRG